MSEGNGDWKSPSRCEVCLRRLRGGWEEKVNTAETQRSAECAEFFGGTLVGLRRQGGGFCVVMPIRRSKGGKIWHP